VLELDPNDPAAWWTKAELLIAQGRIDEALQDASEAAALDPLSSLTLLGLSRGALLSRRYEEADRLREVLMMRNPDNVMAAWYLMQTSLLAGRRPEELPPLFPVDSEEMARFRAEPSASLALLLSLGGEADSARVVIDRVVSSFGEGDRDLVQVWPTYSVLGEKGEAFHWMERSIQELSPSARFIGVDPLADPLRDDPRYQALLDRMGLGHLKARFDSLAAADPWGGI
jgi:tetratricopeptide (TPR) repeat protein